MKQLKFGSLNVSGLKQRLNYPEFVNIIENFDIFCTLETHLDSTDIVDIDNYVFFSKHRSQPYKRKSGGIGIYVRNTLAPYVTVHTNESEYILWLSISREITGLDQDFILGALYLPPENSRFYDIDLFNILETEIAQKCAENKYVCLAGDINARIGTLRDYTISDRHLNNIFGIDQDLQMQLHKYTILENLSIPLERVSEDKRTNSHGLQLIDICKNCNLFIFNGRLFNDKTTGKYTFRDKSVIDYVLSTAECFKFISDFDILETDALYSDGHNPLSWTLKIHYQEK